MDRRHLLLWLLLAAGLFIDSATVRGIEFGPARILLEGKPAPLPSSELCGLRVIVPPAGPQVVITAHPASWAGSVERGEEILLTIPLRGAGGPIRISAELLPLHTGGPTQVSLGIDDLEPARRDLAQPPSRITFQTDNCPADATIRMRLVARDRAAGVWWRNLTVESAGKIIPVPLSLPTPKPAPDPAPQLPLVRDSIEQFLIEWDWRMQDGIDTPLQPANYADAIAKTLAGGEKLLADLAESRVDITAFRAAWNTLQNELRQRSASPIDSAVTEDLWRRVHRARRQIALANPLARTGAIAFVKHVPVIFSHQLTQYYGSCARPGGGVFVLESPGQSMRVRELAPTLSKGSFQHLDVSFDGKRLIFAHCDAPTSPRNREQHLDRFYRLYEVAADGTGLRQLTSGSFDDFSPRYLPDGQILFISTRRGGFHRCGRGPCAVYTMSLANSDGSNPRTISFHETHEWDPAVMNDGRIVYTRWDYVDRNAVHYQHLWSAKPDGSNVQIYYGNNTLNPVGVWEPRAIPGTSRIIATAAAHHAMTAGSIILLDVGRGIDGLDPITRLTPDALFPESEAPVAREAGKPGAWYAPAGVTQKPAIPPEAARWPGHCYRSPWPLSEKVFLAAYSFDPLIGEPNANKPNMFGLYLVDAHGNKELLYRDLNVSSIWPMPLAPRQRPPTITHPVAADAREGTFFVQNVHQAWPAFPPQTIKRLRIVQVLPKSTPHINAPAVGLANASPGKQVLGTVPVETDGSAYFRAPAGIPLAFQALDERGQAVQIMRSLTYLQPGEQATCIGCHEHRNTTPVAGKQPLAIQRAPSAIQPGPDGSNPFSFPILVQPVLDAKCVSCHRKDKPDGNVILTGEVQGRYTRSYNELVKHVPFAAWGNGLSLQANSEPATQPDHFGARASKLMKSLLAGHYKVELTADEIARLVTWMDANALFYGTFDEKDQAKQLKGQRIDGPKAQ